MRWVNRPPILTQKSDIEVISLPTLNILLVFDALLYILTGLVAGFTAIHSQSVNLVDAPQQTEILKVLANCCGLSEPKALHRVNLTGEAVCNDGSPAGYYIRHSHGSRRWIVFLEGGWYCYDQRSCHNRWHRMNHLMSSKQWPDTRNVGGLLSPNPEENPYWWNANHVFVPYCSSDVWSGQHRASQSDSQFSFMGSVIVQEVIKDLLTRGLESASSLLLAGSSAGGMGVMLNLDPVKAALRGHKHIALRGVSDSGWFLDRPPYTRDGEGLAPVDALKRGILLWDGQVPRKCQEYYGQEPWRCYFGYRLYHTLTTPLFVFQWLFDEAQMTADNVGTPVTKQQWDYIHKMGDSLRNTFQNVTSVFAPSCISHSVLTKRDWRVLRIDDVTLPQALRCWELQIQFPDISFRKKDSSVSMLSDSPLHVSKSARNLTRSAGPQTTQRKRRRRKNKNKNRGKKRKERKGNRMRPQRSTAVPREQACQHRLIERCSWPQCNHSCPKLRNPFTGEEMDFLELLKSFGLDLMSVANALGIDINTLNNMDPEELLNLLTQQSN
ncbi:palmitoleoyl-protein carboxylesterase NOTUM [Macrosteles quadrilineatus]|uniref:palmitoleoyl-protein carboxylesterase NOTUM n=1 Tax=Macrosteles quadrilineatus TaxID=74068 RepID=UPI0023E10240|nr:palmitoleoyl-protein carboxylesterase NOTUM [Macrosteles quadrilineatus]